MSINQLETNQVKVPFLGKPHYPISSLDQLGLNLTSERIFALLLPGLNNVTKRVQCSPVIPNLRCLLYL
jgi:hypothetical protein